MTSAASLRALLAAALALLLVSCDRPVGERPVLQLSGSTMGTTFDIQLVSPPENVQKNVLEGQVLALLARIEQSMSTYEPESELSRFNAQSGSDWFAVSAELCELVATAQHLSDITDGAFDVTVGPLVNLWGFGPDFSVTEPPGAERIAEALQSTGNRYLRTDCSMPALAKDLPALYVDLSAYAKGYGVDQIAELLSDSGIGNYLVEIGGEIRVAGTNAKNRPWSIAVEAPDRGTRSVSRIVKLSNIAMATSGDYRNLFEHDGHYFSHIIDPRNGYPVSNGVAAVTVLSDSSALADAMATAMMVLGADAGLQLAERQNLAVLFQLRTGNEVEQRMSTRFAREVTTQ